MILSTHLAVFDTETYSDVISETKINFKLKESLQIQGTEISSCNGSPLIIKGKTAEEIMHVLKRNAAFILAKLEVDKGLIKDEDLEKRLIELTYGK